MLSKNLLGGSRAGDLLTLVDVAEGPAPDTGDTHIDLPDGTQDGDLVILVCIGVNESGLTHTYTPAFEVTGVNPFSGGGSDTRSYTPGTGTNYTRTTFYGYVNAADASGGVLGGARIELSATNSPYNTIIAFVFRPSRNFTLNDISTSLGSNSPTSGAIAVNGDVNVVITNALFDVTPANGLGISVDLANGKADYKGIATGAGFNETAVASLMYLTKNNSLSTFITTTDGNPSYNVDFFQLELT